MKIDCKQVWDHISSYIDGDLDPELRKEIDRHLEHCSVCSATIDSTRNIVVLMADERVYEIPACFSKKLHDRLNEAIRGDESDHA